MRNERGSNRRSELRALREALGLRLEDLSARTGFTPAYLSRLETGERNLTLTVAWRLLEALRNSTDGVKAPARESER